MNIQLTASYIQSHLSNIANPQRAQQSQKFFKTGKGEYSEHDTFIGITVPQLRTIAKEFKKLSLPQIQILITSKIHEERLLALFILVGQYKRSNDHEKETIYQFYLDHLECVNNWDLVDSSAHLIIGPHPQIKNLLIELSESPNLWKRRIAIVATWHQIKQNDFSNTLIIALQLLHDTHDLIHKAVGWMLREAGKRDNMVLEAFLMKYAAVMPRTMLRYAIEKLPEEKRQFYLKK